MKSYRPWSPTQSFLVPPSPLEWLPEGHLAYFVLEVAQALDLSAIEDAIQEKDGRGERPYPPAMMVALLVYGYCVGVFSSRRVARATYEDATPAGKAIYARRKVIVEPVFGQIKQARGFRRFSFRGIAGVRAEWSLVCATHNLLKLFRSGAWAAITATAPA